MQAALARCKAILTGILTSAGEARGENPEVTTLAACVGELADEWRAQNAGCPLLPSDRATAQADPRIGPNAALKTATWNVLDNSPDASNNASLLLVESHVHTLVAAVRLQDPGLAPH